MEFLATLYDQESREDRWFQMISAIKPYAFGARCHGFLLAALRFMCPLTAEDTAEALRDSEDDDSKVFFAKRLKRGVKRLLEGLATESLMVVSVVSFGLQEFNYMLLSEAKDPRLQPARGTARDATAVQGPSLLRKLLQGGRASIKKVANGFRDLLVNDEWVRFCNKTSGDDQRRRLQVVRVARATLLRFSGQCDVRIINHFDADPYDFVLAQDLDDDSAKRLYQKFHDLPRCCLHPYFGRRVRRMSKGVEELMQDAGFQELLNFWVDDGEAVTSIRNERQHACFGRSLSSRKASAARPSVLRVFTESMCKTIRNDHRTQFGKASKRMSMKGELTKCRKSLLMATKRVQYLLKHGRRGAQGCKSMIPLRTARTAKLEFMNEKKRQAKMASK